MKSGTFINVTVGTDGSQRSTDLITETPKGSRVVMIYVACSLSRARALWTEERSANELFAVNLSPPQHPFKVESNGSGNPAVSLALEGNHLSLHPVTTCSPDFVFLSLAEAVASGVVLKPF